MSSSDRSLGLVRRLVLLAAFPCLGLQAAYAQTEISEVHIEPRVQASQKESLDSSYRSTIRRHVDLVLVPVTITDEMDRVVVGLAQRNFQVFEGKKPQEIKHFSREDAPVSLGVILDMSGSMTSKIERAREAVKELLKASNPQDEFFLVTFADTPHVVQDFTQAVADIQEKLSFTLAKGSTSLLDAIYLGLDKMKEAKYQRKALLVISVWWGQP